VLRSDIHPPRSRIGADGKAACQRVAAPQAGRSGRYTNQRRLGYFEHARNSKNNKHLKAFVRVG
jgi:hypothetical protein